MYNIVHCIKQPGQALVFRIRQAPSIDWQASQPTDAHGVATQVAQERHWVPAEASTTGSCVDDTDVVGNMATGIELAQVHSTRSLRFAVDVAFFELGLRSLAQLAVDCQEVHT